MDEVILLGVVELENDDPSHDRERVRDSPPAVCATSGMIPCYRM